jgi:hypothetical protein
MVLMNQGTTETLGPTLCAAAGGDPKGTDPGEGVTVGMVNLM